MPKKILFITLSNIGDVVCTTPVLRRLLDRPDRPCVSILVGPKAAEIFRDDLALEEVIVYDKHAGLREKLALLRRLRSRGYDEVVDLRNTLWPIALLGWRGIGSLISQRKKGKGHALLRHLQKVFGAKSAQIPIRFHVPISKAADHRAEELLGTARERFIVVAPGAASDLKRWPLERFKEIIWRLGQAGYGKVIVIGGPENQALFSGHVLDLCGKTSLPVLAAVLKRASLLISNDSGPMHMAAALGTPVVAIFGPSNSQRYGPFGAGHAVVRKDLACSPCGQAQCPLGTHACMQDLGVEEVWNAVELLLEKSLQGVQRRSNPAWNHVQAL